MKIKTKIGIFALAFALFANCASPVLAELFSGSGVGPTASFTASPTAAMTGNKVTFDASASRDARGSTNLKYRWDFEGRYNWTSWSTSAKTSYIFQNEGDFTARLQVKDVDNLVDETAGTISVATKRFSSAPVAQIHVSPESGDTTTNFRFTVDVFSNIHTPTDELEVRWDWNHDGKWDTSWSHAREFFHVFPDSLYQEVWLQVRDVDGSSSIEKGLYVDGKEDDSIRNKVIGRILVEDATAPLASFETWPVAIDQNTLVHFDASPSIRAVDYRWDFNGDGRFDNSWSPNNQKIQYIYKNVGVFDAVLEVRNSAGEIDSTKRTISVTDKSNILPVASFTMRNLTNSALGGTLAVLRDEVRFAANVHDEDGAENKIQLRWDFDGDGIWDTTFSTSQTATHEYTETGIQKPILQIRDELGGVATATGRIEVVANTPPRATLSVSPSVGAPGSYFRFDASGSRDDQTGTSNLEFRFDFNGDGLFDTEFTGTKSYSKVLANKTGKLTAKVEVRDHANATATATADFEIVVPGDPTAGFTVEPRVGTFATNFEFDASPSIVGALGGLKYRWDFDYRGENDRDFSTGWSTSPIYRHKFSEIGDHRIRLVVQNSAGLEDDVFGKIKIHADSVELQYLRQKNIIASEENPDGLITRAELAQLIVKATKISARSPSYQEFTDVPNNSISAKYISAVAVRGWISSRRNFAWQPDGSVNRAEASKIILSALYPKVATQNSLVISDVPSSAWYARFAETAVAENLLTLENGKFNPGSPVTRGEAARMIATLLQKYSTVKRAALLEPAVLFSKISELFD
ncbi:MAG: PKD domain-containing protein [Patescibacteria group bacterium]